MLAVAAAAAASAVAAPVVGTVLLGTSVPPVAGSYLVTAGLVAGQFCWEQADVSHLGVYGDGTGAHLRQAVELVFLVTPSYCHRGTLVHHLPVVATWDGGPAVRMLCVKRQSVDV